MGWLLALFVRVALLFIWLTTPVMTLAFHRNWIIPLLGILFLPVTTLIYLLLILADGSVMGEDWLWIVLALLLDLGVHSLSTYTWRHRIPEYQ
jgi:hypothetical protein